jgi:hypothetical protein
LRHNNDCEHALVTCMELEWQQGRLLKAFAPSLQARPVGYNEVHAEIHELLDGWRNAFGDLSGTHANEENIKVDLTAEI